MIGTEQKIIDINHKITYTHVFHKPTSFEY